MEYVGLDKEKFNEFIKELTIAYSDVSKEKAKIYYDFFVNEQITIEELNKAKYELYRSKTSSWFPTMAEIRNAVVKIRELNKKLSDKEKMDMIMGLN